MLNKITSIFLILFFAVSMVHAKQEQQAKPIKVGIMLGQPPFAYVNKHGEYEGLTIKIWEFVAKDLNLDYEYVVLNSTYDGIVQDVYNKKVDVAVAPLSVTYKRLKFIDYSRPYFMNNVGIAVSSQKKPFIQIIISLFGRMLMIMATILCVAVCFIGLSLWAVEHRSNKELPKGFFKGIAYTMWVTAGTFLGHMFYKPSSIAGRGIIYSWLFLSLIIMTVVIALATSSLTVAMAEEQSSITSLSDLKGKEIAVENGSFVVDVAKGFGIKVKTVKDSLAGLKLIEKGGILGFMGDYFLMHHMIVTKGIKHVQMAPLTISNDEYAFAYSKGNPLKDRVDKALVKLQENKVAAGVCTIFLGKSYEQNCVF